MRTLFTKNKVRFVRAEHDKCVLLVLPTTVDVICYDSVPVCHVLRVRFLQRSAKLALPPQS